MKLVTYEITTNRHEGVQTTLKELYTHRDSFRNSFNDNSILMEPVHYQDLTVGRWYYQKHPETSDFMAFRVLKMEVINVQ